MSRAETGLPRWRSGRDVGVALALATIGLALTLAGCGRMPETDAGGDVSDTTPVAAGPGPVDGDEATGRVSVRLEQIEGFFIEGFEVGLRFETTGGDLIGSTLWSDHVASTGRPGIEAFYDSVLVQTVPAGAVVVSAEVNIGTGPAPSIPDLAGPLPCVLDVEVEPDGEVAVEVSFDGTDDCLRSVAAPTTPGALTAPGATTTTPPTITTPLHPSQPEALAVGSAHYVDVDLECRSFRLGGLWVLVDGEPATWQPPGERHEGGTFTIDSPGQGRFVGDAAGTKTATFRLLDDGEGADCHPVPRGSP